MVSNWLFIGPHVDRVSAYNGTECIVATGPPLPEPAPRLLSHVPLHCRNEYPHTWSAHACGRPCYRDLWEGLVTWSEAAALTAAAECRLLHAAPGRPSAVLGECDDSRASAPVLRRLARVLRTHYGVPRPTLSHRRTDIVGPGSAGNDACFMHTDLDASRSYAFTFVVALSSGDGDDFEGGETGVAESWAHAAALRVNGSARLMRVTHGSLVVPVLGRALAFSAGDENPHCRMPVLSGRRVVMQTWWRCGELEGRETTSHGDMF